MHDQVTSNLHLISTYLIQSLKVSIFRPTCVNDALMMQHHRKEVTMQNDVSMYDNSRNEDKTVAILSILWQLEVFTFCPVYLYWNDIMTSSNGNLFRSALLANCVCVCVCVCVWGGGGGGGGGIGGFPSKRPVTRGFDVFLNCAWTNGGTHNRDAIALIMSSM